MEGMSYDSKMCPRTLIYFGKTLHCTVLKMTEVRDRNTYLFGQTEIESDIKSFLAPSAINVMKKTCSGEIRCPSQGERT